MSTYIAGPQRLTTCPKEYQDRITAAGGTNRYGEPHFKLVWGEAHKTRAGGYWEQEGGAVGYRDVYLNDSPCWLLLEWHDPSEYGNPTSYYIENYDEATGLQILGEYPYKGKYEVLFILRDTRIENGQLVVDNMPLNAMLIDTVIPLMILGKHISHERRAQALKELKEREEQEKLNTIIDARLDAQLAFKGNPFKSRHGGNTSLIEKKAKVLEAGMMQALRQMRQWGHGISQH
jgi:hypothetical protein